MQKIQMTIFHHSGEYDVDLSIDGREFFLGTYPNMGTAAGRMSAWVTQRGFKWASDSARRLAEAQRTNSDIVTLDVVPLTEGE